MKENIPTQRELLYFKLKRLYRSMFMYIIWQQVRDSDQMIVTNNAGLFARDKRHAIP